MEREFLQLDIWDQMTAAECEEIARTLAKCLPKPWKFDKVQFHEMGDQKRHVALLDWEGKSFSLVPGGQVVLGYDRNQPFTPSAGQMESWRGTEEAYGMDLHEYLHHCLTPLRTVRIAPLLVQASPGYWAALKPAHRDFGFRLITSDEWEHACAAGSRTLFRWGNDCPASHYPGHDGSQLEIGPNAFGLQIAFDAYDIERVAESEIFRGGDGGCNCCGGVGFFAGWIPLASAFMEPELANTDPEARIRLAFPLENFLS